jgi:ATP-binding cassette, subfamily B, bacterial CvaB/MchF/RaxB
LGAAFLDDTARVKAPLILQTEAAECGLACLAMVAGAHGLVLDLPAMRTRFSLSLKGVTLPELARMAGTLQLQGRALRAEPAHLAQLRTPCILHWDMNHFVVLVRARGHRVWIHDPAQGARQMSWEEAAPHFSGIALELTPQAGFVQAREVRQARLSQLVGPVTGLRRGLAQIFALALVLEAFVLLNPFLLQWVVDDVLPAGDRDRLWVLAVGFAGLVVFQAATAALRGWAVLKLSASLNRQWLSNVFAHLVRLPLPWFEKRHAGDIWSRFGAVREIQHTLTGSFVEAVLDGLLVVLTLVLMLVYSPMLASIAAGAVALYAALRALGYRRLRRASEALLVHESRQASHFLESLRGMAALKLFGAEPARSARFEQLVADATGADIAARRLDLAFASAHRLLFGLERVAVVATGAWLVMEQRLSLGMLFAFLAYKEQFALRCSGLIDRGVELWMLRLQAERLSDIALAAPEALAPAGPSPRDSTPGPGPMPATRPPPAIELIDLRFRYADGEPDVLRGVNLRIAPGEALAITGPSGGGKSTLVKLLLGLYVPTGGEIRIDGRPLSMVGVSAWRSRVGAVLQDEPLFAGSLLDNVTGFDPRPDLPWATRCARLAAVADEIEALPMGWQTLAGDLGHTLSGGQKQRLLLARALYRRPQLLLLDEATSALDLAREQAVNDAVRALPLTRIVIAHRPQTVAAADRVVVLEGGRIVTAGEAPWPDRAEARAL